jgi:hypothetical protein
MAVVVVVEEEEEADLLPLSDGLSLSLESSTALPPLCNAFGALFRTGQRAVNSRERGISLNSIVRA